MVFLAIIGLIVFLILVHELGHFFAAKLSGVRVEEFGIGFPPRLLAFRRGETVYSLNSILFGGFVRLAGEDDPRIYRGLASKGILTRIFVLSSGCLMNALLPILLFTFSFMLPRDTIVGDVVIQEISPHSPAYIGGLLPGDRILEANNKPVRNYKDLLYEVRLSLGKPMSLLIEREGKSFAVYLIPRLRHPPEEGPLGIKMILENERKIRISHPPPQAFVKGLETIRDVLKLFVNEIRIWIAQRKAPEVGGPVAVAQLTGEVVKMGFSPFLSFIALISINLAIINLFPFPALDGGRLAFTIAEGITRRRISPHKQRLIHFLGFITLLILLFIITYFDVLRLFRGERILP